MNAVEVKIKEVPCEIIAINSKRVHSGALETIILLVSSHQIANYIWWKILNVKKSKCPLEGPTYTKVSV